MKIPEYMKEAAIGLTGLFASFASPVLAQNPQAPPSICERLAGASREQCIREERERADRTAKERDPEPVGSCDVLVGPEREYCLRRGGTVETGAKSNPDSARLPRRKNP